MGKAVFHGLLAGAFLLSLYLLIMGFASGSWKYTFSQLINLRYWILALVLGFGVQVGLFSYLKHYHKDTKLTGRAVSTGAGTSSAAMLACCAHHLTDILPILGLSAVSLILAKYQTWFLAVGVISNLTGIFLMVKQLRRIKK